MNPSDQARQVGVVDSWLAQYTAYAGATNPGADAVIADVGALAAGYYDVTVVLTASDTAGAADLGLEHRNAGNTATLFAAYMDVGAGYIGTVVIHWWNYKVAASERFRVIVVTGFTGHAVGSILAVRRA